MEKLANLFYLAHFNAGLRVYDVSNPRLPREVGHFDLSRGEGEVKVKAKIAVDDHLDPRIIGDAAATGRYDPQALKRVWHYLARFGPQA
ncbi:hypothetical protein GCM10022224_078670 [Nonomuraea antimicrobica]|uniref:Uncharacterized protein n=1 Tax=Nonomuraea antimicrobica TaxID=561173 RepID=A0ABP7DBQ5_9ACTN